MKAIDNEFSPLNWFPTNITLPPVHFDDSSIGAGYDGYQSELLLIVENLGIPHLARFYIEMEKGGTTKTYWNLEETTESLEFNDVRNWAYL